MSSFVWLDPRPVCIIIFPGLVLRYFTGALDFHTGGRGIANVADAEGGERGRAHTLRSSHSGTVGPEIVCIDP